MAVDRTSPVFIVSSRNEFDRFEQGLANCAPAERIRLEVTHDADVLTSLAEFRRLARLAHDCQVEIVLVTEDPIRRELARISGMPQSADADSGAPDQHPVRPRRVPDADTTPPEQPNPHDAITQARIKTEITDPELNLHPVPETTRKLALDDSQPSFSFVITPPVRSLANPTPRDAMPMARPYHARLTRRRRRYSRATVLVSMTAVGLLVGSLLMLVGFLAPTATITLAPESTEIATELTYGIAGYSPPVDLAIEPQRISTTVNQEAEAPATGERFEPEGFATGLVLFTNPLITEIAIPAGTLLLNSDGIEFSTIDEVAVPAADPFGTLTFGSSVTEIIAVAPGPQGNVTAESISGQLDSGLFYSNREATSGGTMKRIPVVTDTDISNLEIAARNAVEGQANDAVTELLGHDTRLLDGSISISDIAVNFDQIPGNDAENIRVSVQATVSALVYSPDELNELARTTIGEKLLRDVDVGEVLLTDSIQIGAPSEIWIDGAQAYSVAATATKRSVITQEQVDRLRSDLVGASEAEAREIVGSSNGVASYQIQYGPDWLPIGREPRLRSRITIYIDE